MLKIGILASGGLGQIAVEHLAKSVEYSLECVLTDSNSETIISFCKKNTIPFFKGNPRDGRGFDFLLNYEVDILISINYLFLIEKDIINFPSKLIFNIHGSLLPKYRGRTPHVWSIINGEEEAGITAHIIDEGCDTGDILHQIRITIDSNDTGATILEKYNQHYLPLIDKILLDFQNNKLSPRKQNELDASYFGKRTPESGQIDWSWDTNRIRNWVRAQALPYPGAFSFIDGIKIIIDKVETISTIDFKGIVNGTIVTIDNSYCVKCSDGIVKLTNIRTNTSIIKNGKIFK